MAEDRDAPLWEPLSIGEQYVITRALNAMKYGSDINLGVRAARILNALTQTGRTLGVTCDPV